jgi:predicted RNase H-like nuclease
VGDGHEKRVGDGNDMRVIGVDACRRGWVAVSLDVSGLPRRAPRLAAVRTDGSLAGVLGQADRDPAGGVGIVGIDMPLGLLESGWRQADRAARGLLGPRRSSVFAIPPRAVWAQPSYQAANELCRELTGQGFSVQAWGLRAKLLEANQYREACQHPMYEVHPELAFGAMAGAPLEHSKHTPAGRELRRELLAQAGIVLPASSSGHLSGTWEAPVTDTLDAAAVAWSAGRIATGQAVILPDRPQRDSQGCQITIRY